MYFHIKSLRSHHWLAPVDVLYAEVKTCLIWYQSLITLPLGISEGRETISKFQLETCLFHIVWCSLLSWWCWKRMYSKRKYYTTLCFLRWCRGWTMYLFEFLNLSRLLASPFRKMIKYGIWLNCKSLFFSYFMIVLAGLLKGMSWYVQYYVNLPDIKHLTYVHIKVFKGVDPQQW